MRSLTKLKVILQLLKFSFRPDLPIVWCLIGYPLFSDFFFFPLVPLPNPGRCTGLLYVLVLNQTLPQSPHLPASILLIRPHLPPTHFNHSKTRIHPYIQDSINALHAWGYLHLYISPPFASICSFDPGRLHSRPPSSESCSFNLIR